MNEGKQTSPSMGPRTAEAEEFMAILLWSQRRECDCLASKYFRKMAAGMMDKYIPKVEGEISG